jgi:uncharacterized membrane protein
MKCIRCPSRLQATALALCSAAVAQGPVTFQLLGPSLTPGALVTGISDDGSTLVGNYRPSPGSQTHGFRWRQSGVQDLGVLPNHNISNAAAVNGNGDTAVGSSSYYSFSYTLPNEAARALSNSQFGGLGILPGGTMSIANGVDTTGDVIVGWADAPGAPTVPVAWLLGLIQTLSTGMSTDNMWAVAPDDHGTNICGVAQNGAGTKRALLWSGSGAGGPITLPALPGHTDSDAIAISSAGDIVVGHSWGGTFYESVRWRNGVIEQLGQPRYSSPGSRLEILCANADCTLLGGQGTFVPLPIAPRPLLWKEGRGWIDVGDLLWRLGVNLGGATLMSIQGISADGSVIVGQTTTAETFVLRNLPLDGFDVRDIGCGTGVDIYHFGVPAIGQGFGINVLSSGLKWILAGAPVAMSVPGCATCTAGAVDIAVAGGSVFVSLPNAPGLIGVRLAFQGVDFQGYAPYPCLGAFKFSSTVDVTIR